MPRNLALNISVGALLNNSVGRVFRSATQSTNELGQQQRRLNQQLGQVRSVQRYTERLQRLQTQAQAAGTVSQSLARRIQNARAQFSAASAEARQLGVNVDNIAEAEQRLKRQIERNNSALQNRKRLGQAGQSVKQVGRAAGQGLMSAGLLGGTTFGASLAAITATNQMAAEQANLAAAVGLSRQQLAIWAGIVKQAGFDADAVVDLIEELNNKFGESKGLYEQTTAVTEALSILRLDFEKLKQLKPDQQFRAIVEATQRIGGQEAVAAADILLGGEANKIIGYLNSLNLPVSQLFSRFEKLYIGSEQGLEGAKTFSAAWGELTFTLSKALQDLTGVIGAQLAPQMQKWAESTAYAFKNNRNKITEFAATIGSTLAQLGNGLVSLAANLPVIIQAMTRLSNLVLKWFGSGEDKKGGFFSGWFGDYKEKPNSKPSRSTATTNALNDAIQQTRKSYSRYSDPLKGMPPVTQDNRMNVSINVQQQPGESGASVAEQIKIKLQEIRPQEPTLLYADAGNL